VNSETEHTPADSGSLRIAAAFDSYRRGQLDAARTVFADYMHDPKHGVDARRGLAAVAWQRGQHDGAIQLLREAVRVAPDHPDARADLALLLMMAGRPDESLEHWQRRLELKPHDAAAWHNLAKALVEVKRYRDAQPAFERALELDPGQVGSYVTYARAMQAADDWATAESVWRRALTVSAAGEAGYIGLGGVLFKQARLDEALEMYRESVLRYPQSPDLHLGFAQMLEDFSDKTGAEAEFRKALELRPGWAMALEGILTLKRAEATDDDIAAARAVLANPQLPVEAHANVGFGLGKALDAKGDAQGAIEVWTAANQARRQQIGPYKPESAIGYVDRLIDAFSESFLSATSGWGIDDPRPVFVVGMPRSGTSLVEQILSSHPEAYGYGELTEMPKLGKGLPGRLSSIQRWPEVIGSLTPEVTREVAGEYLDALMARERVTASRLIDKAPMNYHYVGLILTLFPNAHIVWCQRDPRDIGVSVFAENFGLSQRYATDLADIGHYFRQYNRLMRHWYAHCADRIHICRYEDMIAAPEERSRDLVAAVGLEWDENCLRFYEHERPVLTPSRWQVRSPIYRGAVARWERYGDALEPLIQALGDEVEGYGYV